MNLLVLAVLVCNLFTLLVCVGAQSTPNTTDLVCIPFGTCEPCPESALNQPFCKPFGNRRLMHCMPKSSLPSGHPNAPPTHAGSAPPDVPEAHKGEIPAWESCGRIVAKERGDFYEFVACILGIAIVGVGAVLARSKRLQAMQARQLAARIGLVRPTPPGWSES